jgi:antitoxin HigA-1
MRKLLRPVHPGEILREEFLKPLGLSMNALALDLHVPVTRIAEVVHERRAITPDTALRLARYFDTTPQFWMNLQVTFDLETAKDQEQAKVNREVRPKSASRAPAGTSMGQDGSQRDEVGSSALPRPTN